MMVVAHAIFEAGWESGRLNASQDAFGNQEAERVVDGLERDRANLCSDDLGDCVGRDMRLTRHRAENRQPLGRHLNTELTKKIDRVRHGREAYIRYWTDSKI